MGHRTIRESALRLASTLLVVTAGSAAGAACGSDSASAPGPGDTSGCAGPSCDGGVAPRDGGEDAPVAADAGSDAERGDSESGAPADADAESPFAPCPSAGKACVILPLGDSITFGYQSSTGGGYRLRLLQDIWAANENAVFVGANESGPDALGSRPFPRDNAGYSGYTIDDAPAVGRSGIAPLVPAALAALTPNIVTLMIGTNDVDTNDDLASAPGRLAALIDAITTASPDALLVLAQITPTGSDAENARVEAYNAAIPALVQARAAAGKHVVLVDMYAAFTADATYKTDYLTDNLHPSDAGYAVMADAWFKALEPYLASTAVDPATEQMHQRADQALATLMLSDWPALAANTTTYDWMYAHYWDAVLDATDRRGPNAFTGTRRMFFDLQNRRGWLDGFYDDENWIALALLHAFAISGDAAYLDQAKTVFDDIEKAWDTTCCLATPGGLWWQKGNSSQGPQNKVTAINAGAVVTAARLYAATKDASYLAFANKAYDYWATYMVDTTTGHVHDGMNNAGSINTTWSFTYNEGLFIGAGVELDRAAGVTSHAALTRTVAGYMLGHEVETTSLGTVLSDGKCGGDGEMFKGIGARYLNELYALDTSHAELRDLLHRSADAAWTLARDPATGNMSCDWAGPYDAATGVVGSLGSAAIALAAAAEALGPGMQRTPLFYEAEEGDLHGIGLEAGYTGFTGWGYLAGWGADGQSVDIDVSAPSAGAYELTLRYATGDNATRALSVNGKTVSASLAFPSTGGYTAYARVATPVTLAKGANTITLAYASAQGSGGYLNLDYVGLKAK